MLEKRTAECELTRVIPLFFNEELGVFSFIQTGERIKEFTGDCFG